MSRMNIGFPGDPVDVARVVTKEDASDRSEGADQIGLPSDRGFDATDVSRERGVAFIRHDSCHFMYWSVKEGLTDFIGRGE